MVIIELNKFLNILDTSSSLAFIGFRYFDSRSELVCHTWLIGNRILWDEKLTFEEIMRKRCYIGLIRRDPRDVNRSQIIYKKLSQVLGFEKAEKYFANNSVSIPELIEVDLTQNWSYLSLRFFLKGKVHLNLGIDDTAHLDLKSTKRGKRKWRFKLI